MQSFEELVLAGGTRAPVACPKLLKVEWKESCHQPALLDAEMPSSTRSAEHLAGGKDAAKAQES